MDLFEELTSQGLAPLKQRLTERASHLSALLKREQNSSNAAHNGSPGHLAGSHREIETSPRSIGNLIESSIERTILSSELFRSSSHEVMNVNPILRINYSKDLSAMSGPVSLIALTEEDCQTLIAN